MTTEIEEICKKLHDDYNGDILEETKDEEIKEVFKNVSKEYKDGDKGNTPLLNIIHNHFNGVLPSPNYISGPMSLTYQTSEKYNMKVYIFGEWHGRENTCDTLDYAKSSNIHISKYLQELFLNSDKFIDFYLEDQMFSHGLFLSDFPLDIIRHDFNNCLHPSKRKSCIFKTVRSHFVDSRDIFQKSKYIATPVSEFLSMANGIREYPHEFRLSDFSITNELSKLESYKEITNFVIKDALGVKIIKKELERSDLGEKLIITIIRKILPIVYKQYFTIEEWKEIFKSDKIHPRAGYIFTAIGIVFVDIYAIARMFKTFKKGHNFPQKPRYIIFYGGDAHSLIQRFFLRELGFETKLVRREVDKRIRCLDISGIKLDFK